MHTVIADKKEEVAALCRRHGVARPGEFGSAARGADFDPETSDADFLVEFSPAAGPGRCGVSPMVRTVSSSVFDRNGLSGRKVAPLA